MLFQLWYTKDNHTSSRIHTASQQQLSAFIIALVLKPKDM